MTTRATQIATRAAHKRRRPTKGDAWRAVLDLMENAPDVDEDTLATLYGHFLPRPAKRPRSQVEWVASAAAAGQRAKQIPRLRYLYSDGAWLHATDGYRAHRARLDLPAGAYDVAGTPVEANDADMRTLESTQRVFTAALDGSKHVGTLHPESLPIEHVAEVERAMVRPGWAARNEAWELDYMQPALALAAGWVECWREDTEAPWTPVGLTIDPTLQAVVMPRRIEPNESNEGAT